VRQEELEYESILIEGAQKMLKSDAIKMARYNAHQKQEEARSLMKDAAEALKAVDEAEKDADLSAQEREKKRLEQKTEDKRELASGFKEIPDIPAEMLRLKEMEAVPTSIERGRLANKLLAQKRLSVEVAHHAYADAKMRLRVAAQNRCDVCRDAVGIVQELENKHDLVSGSNANPYNVSPSPDFN